MHLPYPADKVPIHITHTLASKHPAGMTCHHPYDTVRLHMGSGGWGGESGDSSNNTTPSDSSSEGGMRRQKQGERYKSISIASDRESSERNWRRQHPHNLWPGPGGLPRAYPPNLPLPQVVLVATQQPAESALFLQQLGHMLVDLVDSCSLWPAVQSVRPGQPQAAPQQ